MENDSGVNATIAARATGYDRRSWQYLSDHGVVQPTSTKSAAPRFAARELEIARVCRPFFRMSATIGFLRSLSHILRTTIFEHKLRTPEEAQKFEPFLEAARAGAPAVLGVQVLFKGSLDPIFNFYIAASVSDLAEQLDQTIEQLSALPIILINLRETLRSPVGDAAVSVDDDNEGQK